MRTFECPRCGYVQKQPDTVDDCMHPCGGTLRRMLIKKEDDGEA